ncbi:uncharacterized protein LOC107038419 [Diachasma alloeum]|uniref:uncharacterized protein LOC107038419 n=1 Tax=Diachasma alloeum TaxID=454923 RepID=UPI0010FB76B5|nr:uncharacterized protein LOC107038419 [Diachasma alloeum]
MGLLADGERKNASNFRLSNFRQYPSHRNNPIDIDMSEDIGNFTEDLVEAAMSNAMELSGVTAAPDAPSADEPDLKPLSNILREVAQLAKSLQQGMENVQIGDYKVSLTNASPLEIQLKRAISNLEISSIDKPLKIIIKGEGDYEVREDTLISLNKDPGPSQSSSDPSVPPISAASDTSAPTPQEPNLNSKKMTFARRLRRLFRIGPKNP